MLWCNELIVVDELQVVLTLLQGPSYTVLDEILFQVHQLFLIQKSNFRLHHPELSQMSGCVRVFRTECRTKGIDSAQCRSTKLTFQLSGYRQGSLLTKEIIIIDDLPVLILLQVIQVLGRYLEHISCSLAITSCNQRGMEIVEPMLMEIRVDGHGHVMANTHDGTKNVGAKAQMGILAHIFESLPFLLHRIIATTKAIYRNLRTLYLRSLSLCRTLYERTCYTYASSSRDILQRCLVHTTSIHHNLDVLDG